jgi:hypothetical protein
MLIIHRCSNGMETRCGYGIDQRVEKCLGCAVTPVFIWPYSSAVGIAPKKRFRMEIAIRTSCIGSATEIWSTTDMGSLSRVNPGDNNGIVLPLRTQHIGAKIFFAMSRSKSDVQRFKRLVEQARTLRERSAQLQAQSKYLRMLVQKQHYEIMLLMVPPANSPHNRVSGKQT